MVKTRGLHVGHKSIHAAIVESHAIDDGMRLRQAEHAWLGGAGLGSRSHRADFDKAESERRQSVNISAVLIQAGRKSHWVGKSDALRSARIRRRLGECLG